MLTVLANNMETVLWFIIDLNLLLVNWNRTRSESCVRLFFFKNGISVLKSYVISVSIKKINFFLRKSYPTVQDMVSCSKVKESYYYGNVQLYSDYKWKKNTKHSPITVNLTSMNLSFFFFIFIRFLIKLGNAWSKQTNS